MILFIVCITTAQKKQKKEKKTQKLQTVNHHWRNLRVNKIHLLSEQQQIGNDIVSVISIITWLSTERLKLSILICYLLIYQFNKS